MCFLMGTEKGWSRRDLVKPSWQIPNLHSVIYTNTSKKKVSVEGAGETAQWVQVNAETPACNPSIQDWRQEDQPSKACLATGEPAV